MHGLLRQWLRAAATVFVAFLICFALLQGLPGDPLDRLDDPRIPAEQAERTRQALGLDEPIPARLASTIAGYLRGDLGVSFGRRRAVGRVLAEALPATLLLGAAALALAYGLGTGLAIVLVGAGGRRRRLAEAFVVTLSTVPRFWFAVVLVLLFHGIAGWFPASHLQSPGGGGWVDRLWHLVLPAAALGIPGAAVVCRYQLAAMGKTLAAPHVRAAQARGESGWSLMVHHVLRPSSGVTVALLGLDLPVIVSGALVVEIVFSWPGVGRVAAEAVTGADYPLALAVCAMSALVVVCGRMATEALARVLDPRIGTESPERG